MYKKQVHLFKRDYMINGIEHGAETETQMRHNRPGPTST